MFNLGSKAILRFVQDENALAFIKAKLSPQLFKPGDELAVYTYVQAHLSKHRTLPKLETVLAQFPVLKEQGALEPSSYYLELLLNRFEYETIDKANLASQQILANDKTATKQALTVLDTARKSIIEQQFRQQIMDVGPEAKTYLMNSYHGMSTKDTPLILFGWPYLDNMVGTLMPGDLVSIVGRPGRGKTWFTLFSALHNWHELQRNVMFVSMEMNTLAIVQRVGAMYTHAPALQLKHGKMASGTLKAFSTGMDKMKGEAGHLYVVNGNLMAEVDPLYTLAVQLGVDVMVIDGAYMLKHPNRRLDRFVRVAENVELMKQAGEQLELATISSWQFAKTASKKNPKKGEVVTMDDIGYSDAIAQTSSIILGLMQEEGVETMNRRMIELLKGRSGEEGQFYVNWNFATSDFRQIEDTPTALEYV